jgi:hypothetical protein
VTLCPPLRGLAADHARWRARLERRAWEAPASRAARLLALWEGQILPHCQAEEDVLLPELARSRSEADALLVFTLGDHMVLRHLARDLREATPAAQPGALAALEAKLLEHAAFEERTLFPGLQETLGCDRLAGLAADLSAAGARGGRTSRGKGD